jgi:hypothetical protein
MRFFWWLGQHYPVAVRYYVRLMVPDATLSVAEAEKQVSRWGRWMSKPDRDAMQDAFRRTCLALTLAEHRRQGSLGGRYEAEVGMRPWGFTLQDVHCEKMFFWHGEQDRIVTTAQARALAARLPGCVASFFPEEGHFSTMPNHARDILARLTIT